MPLPRPSPFPWEDDDEPPGISIRPLSQADLHALLIDLDSDEDAPPLVGPARA
jgi:hypothetical protein